MMNVLKSWIIGITCAAMIIAAIQSLVPDGATRKVANLAGGLFLLLVLAAPLTKLDSWSLLLTQTEYHMWENGTIDLLKIENKRLIIDIVEEQTESYISDKAERLGISCAVGVVCVCNEEGNVFPKSVSIKGNLTETERKELSQWIENELAVLEKNQTFEEGEEP